MVRHQAPGKQLHAILSTRLQQHVNEGAIVAIFVKYLLPTVTPIDHMIAAVVN